MLTVNNNHSLGWKLHEHHVVYALLVLNDGKWLKWAMKMVGFFPVLSVYLIKFIFSRSLIYLKFIFACFLNPLNTAFLYLIYCAFKYLMCVLKAYVLRLLCMNANLLLLSLNVIHTNCTFYLLALNPIYAVLFLIKNGLQYQRMNKSE